MQIAKILGKRRIQSIHGFQGQKISCGKSWEVNGHEQHTEWASEKHGEYKGNRANETKYPAVSGSAAYKSEAQYFSAKTICCTAVCHGCRLCFLMAGAGGYTVYSRPVSYISIDVNPSIELAVNRFDRVVSAKATTQTGRISYSISR